MAPLQDLKTYTFLQLSTHTYNTTRYLVLDFTGALYWGTDARPLKVVQRTHPFAIARLPRKPLNAGSFFPPFDPTSMTPYHANAHEPAHVFIKKQDLLAGNEFLQRAPRFAGITLAEINVAEALVKSPHPNLCPYLGVVVNAAMNRVTGLAYKRYTTDLHRFAHHGLLTSPAQIGIIMGAVTAAVTHLHRLGFVHCDVRPCNVFLKVGAVPGRKERRIEEVVLGDFDAVTRLGGKIEWKLAGGEWRVNGVKVGDVAGVEVDRFAVGETERWLWRWLERRR
jgi:hypothetical protein